MNGAVWFYLAVSLAAIVWFSWHYALAVESTKWPRVQGRVIRAWAERTDEEELTYSPRVEYEFKVNGVRHRSTTVWLTGDKSMRKVRAELTAASYQAGDKVSVWYDPEKPTRATLHPGGAGWLLVGLLTVSILGPALALAFTSEGRRILGQLGIQVE